MSVICRIHDFLYASVLQVKKLRVASI